MLNILALFLFFFLNTQIIAIIIKIIFHKNYAKGHSEMKKQHLRALFMIKLKKK